MHTLNKLPNLELRYISNSVKGKDRKINEDNYLIIDKPSIKMFFLFDGVGGALNGKKATILSINFIQNNFANYFFGENFDTRKLYLDINNFILDSKVNDALTTVCSLIILSENKNKIIVSNLGDSRVYSFNHQSLRKLSTDDKLSPKSNVITKCLGMEELRTNDIHEIKFQNTTQNFLLCTDGFYSLFEEKKLQFLNIFNSENYKFINKKLDSLIQGRNSDDSSYIIIYC